MTRLALLLVLLPACASTAGRGLTAAWQQRGHALNTRQACLDAPDLLPVADLALVALATEAVTQGWAASYGDVAAALGRPGVCLVQRPEPCCLGAYCQRDTDGAVRDKAGCAVPAGAAWVSKEWPAGMVRDWRDDLFHELSHIVGSALGAAQPANHGGEWGSVEARAAVAFRAALTWGP